MKILYITPCIPTKSDGRRVYNFIRTLAGEHEIHLIALKYNVQTLEQIRELEDMGVSVRWLEYKKRRSVWNCIPGSLCGNPLRVSWCAYPELKTIIQNEVDQKQFDVIHIDRMRMGQFIPKTETPIVLDFTDSLMMYINRSIQFRKTWSEWIVDWWEKRTITAYERKILKQIQRAMVCSYVDADFFKTDHPGYNFEVIRNAVDTEQFKPRTHEPNHKPRLIITGTLFYFPNVDSIQYYVQDILPKIRERFPDIETQIIGTRPLPSILELDGKDGIRLETDVPRMEDCLYMDDIYLCPLRVAAGIRNKLLEAMSAGMPVISTKLGAEGMDVEDGKHLFLAETAGDFIDKIEDILQHKKDIPTLSKYARDYVIEHHGLHHLKSSILSCYESMKK